MSIPVYVLSVEPDGVPAEKVAGLFDDDRFITNVIRVGIPPELSVSIGMTSEEVSDAYRISWALRDAKKKHTDSHVIIVQETSTTNVDPSRLFEIVESVSNDRVFDICYLANWLDRCDLYSDINHLKTKNPDGSTFDLPTMITNTKRPNGTQALLISPHGRDIILGSAHMYNNEFFTPLTYPLSIQLRKNIEEGNIIAVTTQPNVINYDISYVSSDTDYLKLSECTAEYTTPCESTSLSIFWFIVIIIVIVLLAWFATQM